MKQKDILQEALRERFPIKVNGKTIVVDSHYIAKGTVIDCEEGMFEKKSFGTWEKVRDDFDPHVGCFSYPNCDEAPLGCSYQNRNPEPYGHK